MNAGISTTVQDAGRLGMRRYGIPQSGAMDKRSFYWANWLVDNPLDTPVLEFTLRGGQYFFSQKTCIAITGATMPVKINDGINNESFQPNQLIEVQAKSILKLGFATQGNYGYLAVKGNWKIPKILGSCSTYTPARLGGLRGGLLGDASGRLLQKDDIIQINYEYKNLTESPKTIPEQFLPRFAELGQHVVIRILSGPEWDDFSPNIQQTFLTNQYIVLPDSNRMGIRLKSVQDSDGLLQTNMQPMLSSPTVPGTIQINNEGQPIALMLDGQTTGGYPRIAKVIDADLGRLAQVRTGELVSFKLVDLEEANAQLLYQKRLWV